ncbi:IclR family transcriptional regulator [Pseudonocardia asaccharolytica]|uniref:IclR family transcriptional regulator n=1 Tax=Pseudonocardia asaccharolytica TaxID=54010 RepID=UPI001377D752|nr:IclR family transcriptional regulator [Pseudonocardia asaccharolytica]
MQRAIAVLDALADAGTEVGTNEIARRTGVNVSTISRLLSTLATAGLVQHVPATGRYRLGVRILQLASAARETLDIRTLARPHLEEIAGLTSETATLSIPGEHEVMTLDFVQSPRSVRSVAQVGRNSVRYATSVGKVFLAHGGRLPAELTAFTPRTIADRAALEAEIRIVRERGFATARSEREPDLHAVAVPILDQHAELVAILGVQGPASRFGEAEMAAAVEILRERARIIAAAY